MPKIEPRRTRRKTKVKNKNPENHEEHPKLNKQTHLTGQAKKKMP